MPVNRVTSRWLIFGTPQVGQVPIRFRNLSRSRSVKLLFCPKVSPPFLMSYTVA